MVKIDFHFDNEKPGQMGVYRRCAMEFKARGVDCRFFPDSAPSESSDADMFVVQQHYPGAALERLGRPVIIEEKADSSMPMSREQVGYENVIGCSKVSLVRRDWFNLPVKRAHAWRLDQAVTWPHQPSLNEAQSNKFFAGIHLGMYDRLQPWIDRARAPHESTWETRPIDALFIGQTAFSHPVLTEHRRSFCKSLQGIKELNILCTGERVLSRKEYHRLSGQAKIIVSPWGYGELCHRDFEAMLDECLLVKPRTEFIETLGNVLEVDQTYQPCEVDGSDLESVIRAALRDERYSDPTWRQKNRDRVLHWWSESTIVTWWLSLLNRGFRREHPLTPSI